MLNKLIASDFIARQQKFLMRQAIFFLHYEKKQLSFPIVLHKSVNDFELAGKEARKSSEET